MRAPVNFRIVAGEEEEEEEELEHRHRLDDDPIKILGKMPGRKVGASPRRRQAKQ
jgi:hypothetical protein